MNNSANDWGDGTSVSKPSKMPKMTTRQLVITGVSALVGGFVVVSGVVGIMNPNTSGEPTTNGTAEPQEPVLVNPDATTKPSDTPVDINPTAVPGDQEPQDDPGEDHLDPITGDSVAILQGRIDAFAAAFTTPPEPRDPWIAALQPMTTQYMQTLLLVMSPDMIPSAPVASTKIIAADNLEATALVVYQDGRSITLTLTTMGDGNWLVSQVS